MKPLKTKRVLTEIKYTNDYELYASITYVSPEHDNPLAFPYCPSITRKITSLVAFVNKDAAVLYYGIYTYGRGTCEHIDSITSNDAIRLAKKFNAYEEITVEDRPYDLN